MSQEFLKTIFPFFYLILFARFYYANKTGNIIGAALFFTSLIAFSQNFQLFYRDVHKLIQMAILLYAILFFIKTFYFDAVNKYFSILFVMIFASLIFAPFDEDAREQLLNIFVIMGVVNYLYLSTSVFWDRKKINKYLCDLAALTAVIGICEFVVMGGRIEGTFSNPNYYALFLGISFCIGFHELYGFKRNIYLLSMVVAILISGSRSALFAPLICLLWYLYKNKGLYITMLVGAVLFILSTVLISTGITRLSDTEATEASDAERIIFANIAYRMAVDHPFVGVGWGRFIGEFQNYSTLAERIYVSSGDLVDVSRQERRVSHNDALRILAELGWISFSVMVAFLLYGLYGIVKYNFQDEYIFSVWLGVILFSLTHNNLNSALFWFFFFMPYRYMAMAKK